MSRPPFWRVPRNTRDDDLDEGVSATISDTRAAKLPESDKSVARPLILLRLT
jgi:hypothetical protein